MIQQVSHPKKKCREEQQIQYTKTYKGELTWQPSSSHSEGLSNLLPFKDKDNDTNNGKGALQDVVVDQAPHIQRLFIIEAAV